MIKTRVMLAVMALALAALACNVPSAVRRTTGTVDEVGRMLTQVAGTVAAELSRTPGTPEALMTTTPGQQGSPTAFPTLALLATATQGGDAEPDATDAPCDRASFVSDVSVPDGTRMSPGQSFTKTWRLRNSGSCAWATGYMVVFVQGDAMGAPAAVPLSGPVAPGATVDIAVDMRAPTLEGSYTGYWKLRNAAGEQFGTGADQAFFVQIEVGLGTGTPGTAAAGTSTPTRTATVRPTTASTTGAGFSLAENYCQAEWRSQAGTLACPGIQGDNSGYVTRLTNPRLENGEAETRPVLVTVPNKITDGAITGRFPARTVAQGTRFHATLGCLNGAAGCAVVYQLNYIIGGGSPASLGQWAHTYGGGLQDIDVDLSPLAGKQVELILAVLANGSPEGDQAVWVDPRIE